MATHFTGFWEQDNDWVMTTIGPVPLEDLLERLRVRLTEVPAGAHVRVDLIAWTGE